LENLKGRDHFEDQGTDGRIDDIKMDFKEIWGKNVDWIHLAEDMDCSFSRKTAPWS
jgi:hypothetical protein